MLELSGKVFTDQKDKFPVTSSKGSKYVMVLFAHGINAILAKPMKNISQEEIIQATTNLHKYLTNRGFKPQVRILDNEFPEALKKCFRQNNVTYQLVPPHLYRNNSAECAIATFKDHLIAGLSNVDSSFPMHLWCRLILQATTTLNLLRPSTINPKISTKAILNGAFNYNATPLAPSGTKIIAYEIPTIRKMWAPHGLDGWYIGNASEHYRYHKVYIPKTRAKRIARTVEFFPHLYSMPTILSADAAIEAAKDLTSALQHPHPASLLAHIKDTQLDALRQLAEIFATHTTTPKVPSPPMHPTPRVASPHLKENESIRPLLPLAPATQTPSLFLCSGRNRPISTNTALPTSNKSPIGAAPLQPKRAAPIETSLIRLKPPASSRVTPDNERSLRVHVIPEPDADTAALTPLSARRARLVRRNPHCTKKIRGREF